jgi:hypothetical protein
MKNTVYTNPRERVYILTVTDNLKADEELGIGSQKATNWMKEPHMSADPPVQSDHHSSSVYKIISAFLSSFLVSCVSIL